MRVKRMSKCTTRTKVMVLVLLVQIPIRGPFALEASTLGYEPRCCSNHSRPVDVRVYYFQKPRVFFGSWLLLHLSPVSFLPILCIGHNMGLYELKIFAMLVMYLFSDTKPPPQETFGCGRVQSANLRTSHIYHVST